LKSLAVLTEATGPTVEFVVAVAHPYSWSIPEYIPLPSFLACPALPPSWCLPVPRSEPPQLLKRYHLLAGIDGFGARRRYGKSPCTDNSPTLNEPATAWSTISARFEEPL
jgi:hypothetical protein